MSDQRPQKARVLVLDPDNDFLERVRELSVGHDVILETQLFSKFDLPNLESLVSEKFPDIVILNLDVDDELSFSASITTVLSIPVSPPPMILGTTIRDGITFKKIAYQTGVDDYLVRPFDAEELWLRLDVLLRIRRLQRRLDFASRKLNSANVQLANSNRKLEEMTVTDELTGLSNMRFMAQFLEKHFSLVQRNNRPCAIIMIDLDHFKQVNDKNDHLVGSATLQTVGRVIFNATRTSDVKARYGGDEFLIVLPETDLGGAQLLAARLLASIAQAEHQGVQNTFRVTASIGLACYDAHHHKTYKDLVKSADFAMYLAKAKGRNQVVVFEIGKPDMARDYDQAQSSVLTAIKKAEED